VATTAQIVVPARAAGPIALWHLLSLDAPAVAVLWTWSVANAAHVGLPFAPLLEMALAVWVLYAGDRLLDARGTGPNDQLEARHFFHHTHRRAFLLGIAFAALAVAALLPRLDPVAVRLYLVEGGLLLGWFLILHATHSAHRLPKEIAVGLFFSAAVFIPTVARDPGLRMALLPCAILFAALCSLNCLFIYAWEHGDHTPATREEWPAGARPAHATTRLALAHLNGLAVGVAICGVALAIVYAASPANAHERAIPVACALSASLLLALDRSRRRLSRVDLRAAADLALLTPLLLLPFLR
jgi:hypothetical protein